MRIVRCIGKALGFKADGTTTRIHSAMHAREARQIIVGVHDKPRLCGIDIHSAPTGRTDAGGGERELMQRGFLRIGCMPSFRMISWFFLASSVLLVNQESWTGPPYPERFAIYAHA